MNKITVPLIYLLFSVFQTNAQQPGDPDYIKSQISYSTYFPFIDTGSNFIQYFSAETVRPFFEKLRNSNKKKVSVLHIGDSHLQADIGAGYCRNRLQEIFGFGGRGSIFPYTIAKTRSAYDYQVNYSGKWENSKNTDYQPKFDLGITGITGRTYDSAATFQIDFIQEKARIQPDFRKLKLFCYTGRNSFDFEYRLSEDDDWEPVICQSLRTERTTIELALPYQPASLYFRVVKKDSTQSYFEINGLSLESTNGNGILYHSVGINGATLKSLLKENIYEKQINDFHPDLIILDLITNDVAFKKFDEVTVERDLKSCIRKLRSASPNALIIVAGMQDIYLRGRNIINAAIYSEYLTRFAEFNNVAFYDYFTVSGGRYSMKKWFSNNLSSGDQCHLSPLGYNFKGELFTNALLKSYLLYLMNDFDPLILEKPVATVPIVTEEKTAEAIKPNTKVASKSVPAVNKNSKKIVAPKSTKKKTIVYIAKNGDSVFSIAKKFKVDASKIIKFNKLIKNKILVGQKILIPQ